MKRDSQPDGTRVSGRIAASTRQRLRAATQLARAGKLPAAAAVLQALLAAHPDLPEAHANLGFVLAALQRHAEAEPHFRRMLEARPNALPVLLALAHALQKQGQPGAADAYYQQALEAAPTCVPAMLGAGTCARAQSRLDAACAWFEQAARADPACVDAYYLLSTLRHFDAADPLLAPAEALWSKAAGMPIAMQARLGFALGRMFEDAGRCDAAFAAYAAGNSARASQFVLDESAEDDQLQRTCKVFDGDWAARHAEPPVAAARVPVFVVGMPRSGTTLVEQMLASHPRVCGLGEITDLWDVVLAKLGSAECWPEAALGFSGSDCAALGASYVARAWQRAPHATHVVNKQMLNYRRLGLIRMLLPQARIIHVQRDAMDVCWSCYTRLFDGDNLAFSYDLASLGRYYARYARCMQHWRRVLPPGALLEVRYEDLVGDTEAGLRRILAFLDLEWNARCLAFHRNERVVDTASRAQVRQPIYRSSVGRWKPFAAHLGVLQRWVTSG